jgi:hypothetical protein
MVDDEVTPVCCDGEGDEEDARTTVANSKTWSATWLSSCGIGERRLEDGEDVGAPVMILQGGSVEKLTTLRG